MLNLLHDLPELRRKTVGGYWHYLLQLIVGGTVAEQYIIYLTHLVNAVLVVDTMTVIDEVISREDTEEQQDEDGNGHILIGLRLLHHTAVFA